MRCHMPKNDMKIALVNAENAADEVDALMKKVNTQLSAHNALQDAKFEPHLQEKLQNDLVILGKVLNRLDDLKYDLENAKRTSERTKDVSHIEEAVSAIEGYKENQVPPVIASSKEILLEANEKKPHTELELAAQIRKIRLEARLAEPERETPTTAQTLNSTQDESRQMLAEKMGLSACLAAAKKGAQAPKLPIINAGTNHNALASSLATQAAAIVQSREMKTTQDKTSTPSLRLKS